MVSPPPFPANVAMHLLNPEAGGVRAEQPFHSPKPTFGVKPVKVAPQNQALPSGTGTYTRPEGIRYGEGFGDVTRPLPYTKPATDPNDPFNVDWANVFWGSLGLPKDLVGKINDIFKKYPDMTQAQLIAQQYLRTTPWYAQTFPGIAQGIKAGLFTDEQGYRGYVDQLNVLSNQYLGRHVGTDEVTSALTEGIDPTIFGKRLEGNAWVGANSAEAEYELGAFTQEGRASQSDLTALGRQQVGLTTPLGYTLSNRLQQASARMQALFNGTLAKAPTTLGPQGLYSPALAGQKAQNTAAGSPDIGA